MVQEFLIFLGPGPFWSEVSFFRALVGPGLVRIYFLEIDIVSYYVIVDFEWMTSLKARGHWIESREVTLFSISM